MSATVSTGVRELDRKIGGGLPPGTVVLFTAPPASQSAQLLARLATANKTLYLTTECPEQTVRETVGQGQYRSENVTVEHIDPDAPLDALSRILARDQLPPVVVIDRIDHLESQQPKEHRALLEGLQSKSADTGTVVVMHGLHGSDRPPTRDQTAYMADVVVRLHQEFEDRIVNRLFVPKFRNGRALEEPLSLQMTDRIRVDTSRDIA